jgi:NAD(P)H dehydrogenase (quinone)
MHAPPKSNDPIVDVNRFPEADGFLFGFPTRFGMMASQFKSVFDATGQLWAK